MQIANVTSGYTLIKPPVISEATINITLGQYLCDNIIYRNISERKVRLMAALNCRHSSNAIINIIVNNVKKIASTGHFAKERLTCQNGTFVPPSTA